MEIVGRSPAATVCGVVCRMRKDSQTHRDARGKAPTEASILSSAEADAILELRTARRRVEAAAAALRSALNWDSRPAAPGPENTRPDAWAGYVSSAGWDS